MIEIKKVNFVDQVRLTETIFTLLQIMFQRNERSRHAMRRTYVLVLQEVSNRT